MKALIAVLLLSTLVGCTSNIATREVTDFGMTRLEVKTPDGMSVKLDLGKEYSSFEGHLTWVDGKPDVQVTAIGVSAFEGQALATAAVMEIQRQLTERVRIGGEVTESVVTAITRSVLGGMAKSALFPVPL
jgi:hypothetical protein